MNTCDTCKWWGEEKKSEVGAQAHTHTIFVAKYRDCMCPKLATVDQPYTRIKVSTGVFEEDKADPTGATAHGEDNDRCSFTTGPKFGCIHHENKEAA